MGNRRAFTLVELLITCVIIGMMAAMVIFAMFQASEAARHRKTQMLIQKLDAIIQAKWETYPTRRIPVTIPADATPMQAAQIKLDMLRELMRLELPDRLTDFDNDPSAPNPATYKYTINGNSYNISIPRPAISQGYLRQYSAAPNANTKYMDAECLYMIVKGVMNDDGDAVDVFKPDNIGDFDGDGLPEFKDAWGMPIRFLRWPPGFFSDTTSGALPDHYLQVSGKVVAFNRGSPATILNPEVPTTMTAIDVNSQSGSGTSTFSQQAGVYNGARIMRYNSDSKTFRLDDAARIQNYTWAADKVTFSWSYNATYPFPSPPSAGETFAILKPDPFDYRSVYPSRLSFAISPLIYSAGPNKCYGICSDFSETATRYSQVSLNPFVVQTDKADNQQRMIGGPRDFSGEPNFVSGGWKDNLHNLSGIGR